VQGILQRKNLMTGVLLDFSAVLVCGLLVNDCPQRVEGP
jgi:hypothetical protein